MLGAEEQSTTEAKVDVKSWRFILVYSIKAAAS
jgi:hypothetical protein